jgi:hypothetical protein
MHTQCTLARAHTRATPQIACELVLWRLERSQTVADGLLELARLREVDTLVCGTTGYR